MIPFPPVEPPPTRWYLTAAAAGPGEEVVGIGADLEPGTLLAAYRRGIFPMGLGQHGSGPIGWFAPDPRGVLAPGDLRVSRSLRRSARRLRVSADEAFTDVVAGCADPQREGRWITEEVAAAYLRLHHDGWAHSIEVWDGPDLVGGLYGVAIGGLFAGESMFHRATDASKVALVGLVHALAADTDPRRLIDVQWSTSHLASLGVVEVPGAEYAQRLRLALEAPPVDLARWSGWEPRAG